MPILTGFPPSNTISPGPRIPWVRESQRKICDVPADGRFRHNCTEFMKLHGKGFSRQRAVCYKEGRDNSAGHIYCMNDDLEVTWLEDVYGPHPADVEIEATEF